MEKYSARRAINGFTLIELSIVLVIIGIMASSVFSLTTLYYKRKAQQDTQTNLKKAEIALQSFLEVNRYYPCPANPLLKRNKPGFGRAQEQCVFDPNQTNDETAEFSVEGRNKYRVRSGILPFRSLGIPDTEARDAWGRLFQYAVTEHLTNIGKFDQKKGAIDVLAEDRFSRTIPPASVQYIVFSTGEDGKGGYTSEGVLREACPEKLMEAENCDKDASFMEAPVTYETKHSGGKAGRGSVVSFDDLIVYKQYDSMIPVKGGLLFYYSGECMPGFEPVDVQKHDVSGVATLSKSASFNAPINMNEEQILCYSTRYTTSITLLSKSGKEPAGCPIGWTEIGFKLFEEENGSYRMHSGRKQSFSHLNNIVCAL